MKKRETNWQADIYDLTENRLDPLPPAAVGSAAAAGEDVAIPTVAVRDSGAPPAAPTPSSGAARPAAPPPNVRPRPARSDNQTLAGLVAGALVGAGLTLLVAPGSGAEIRRRLQARLRGGSPHGGSA